MNFGGDLVKTLQSNTLRGAGVAGLLLGVVALSTATSGSARADDMPSWLSDASAYSNGAAVRAVKPRGSKPVETKAEQDDVDTEHIFGFSMGSDIGKKGEVELEIENVGRFGKRAGAYTGVGSLSQVKFTLTDNFRVAPGVSLSSTSASGVPDILDNRRTGIAGASLEFRYKLLDREVMPFGLTLHAAPSWNRLDELTGFDVQIYGSEFAALMDKELVHDRLFAAVNFWFSAGASRDLTNAWSHDSEFAVQSALSYKVSHDLILGLEARYVRAYDGLGLDRFQGEAVFVGPTFSTHLAKNIGLSGTWSTQVAGRALDDPRRLDLSNFERHQALLRLNYLF
jgi:hypothetical protein